jgi:pimeloyl-ACP methyl ester carboxylesterase
MMRGISAALLVLVKSVLIVNNNNSVNAFTVPPALSDVSFLTPDVAAAGISEPACQDAAAQMQRVLVPVSKDVSESESVGISYVHWPSASGKSKAGLPLVLVPGFDSSCLEYRRLGPKLAALGIDVYAVDLLGWGFTQLQDVASFSAQAKVEALTSFCRIVSEQKNNNGGICIGGASLGGAAAIEVSAANPDLCKGTVLIDAQGFVDGVGPMASLPVPLAKLGIQVLKSTPLRSSANQMSYNDVKTYATEDALRVGRLHCLREGWDDALLSFMLSGGFSPSTKVPNIQSPALVLWGRQDGILEQSFADKFIETLPNGRLQYIEECGHVPHLEQADETASVIASFLESDQFPAAAKQQPIIGANYPVGAVVGAAAALSGASFLIGSFQ